MTKGGDGEEHVCVNSGTGGTSHLGDSSFQCGDSGSCTACMGKSSWDLTGGGSTIYGAKRDDSEWSLLAPRRQVPAVEVEGCCWCRK